MTSIQPPWRALLLLAAAAITYGSLYPFHFVEPASVAQSWADFMADLRWFTTRGDVLGNIALFVPFGALGMAALPLRWRGVAGWLALALLSIAFAFAVQVLQIWFPPREPSLADVLWNGVGTVLGMAVGALAVARFGGRGLQLGDGAPVAAFLLLGWVLTQLFPFLPSIDWQLFKDKLKPLLLEPAVSVPATLFVAARVVAAGCLLAALSRGVGAVGLRLLALLVLMLLGKLLVVEQTLPLSTVLGYAVGWLAWLLLSRLTPDRLRVIAFAFLLAGYTVAGLIPFELRETRAVFHWLPFESLLQGSMAINSWALTESVFVYCTLLWLVAQDGGRVPGISIVLALWVGGLEAAQVWIDGRTGDITAPLLVLLSGFVVHRLVGADASPGDAMPRGAAVRQDPQRLRRSNQ